MLLPLIILAEIVIGGFIGYYVNTVVLTILTVGAVLLGMTMPRETLAAAITLVYIFVAGPTLLSAWIFHVAGSCEKYDFSGISKLFLRDRD